MVGEWTSSIEASALSSHRVGVARSPKFGAYGRIAARQALEGSELAPGTEGTLEALRKRATVPREELLRDSFGTCPKSHS